MNWLRKPEWREHPSVKALMQVETAASPQAAIRKRAERTLSEARALGWSGPPFCIETLASIQGFRVKWELMGDDVSAYVHWASTPEIRVNISHSRVRQRFSIAHEISHTFFPDFLKASNSQQWRFNIEAQSPVEQLCQAAAALLLIPSPDFDARNVHDSMIEDCLAVASEYEVSFEVALRRIVSASSIPVIGFVAGRSWKPKELADAVQPNLFDLPVKEMKIRVQRSFFSETSPFLATHKSVPDHSILHRVFGEPRSTIKSAVEDWTSCSCWERTAVEVMSLSPTERDALLVVLREDN